MLVTGDTPIPSKLDVVEHCNQLFQEHQGCGPYGIGHGCGVVQTALVS